MTTCGYCGRSFEKDTAQAACGGCPMRGGGCGNVRCPTCGWEAPEEPVFVRKLRALFGRNHAAQS